MDTTVDSAFIRRAVELADLNAVRVALYQHTGDPEIAVLPTAINLDDAGRELLIGKAVAWLEENAGPGHAARAARGRAARAHEHGDRRGDGRPRVRGPPQPPGVQGLPVHHRLARRQAAAPRGVHGRRHRQRLQRPRDVRAARAARHPVRRCSSASPSPAARGPSTAIPTSASTRSRSPTSSASRRSTAGRSTSGAAPRCAGTSTTSPASTASTRTRGSAMS